MAGMQVFNSLGRELQPFEPRDAGRVAMYLCGPTVQAAPHVGHGRAAVAFDVIRRYLEWRGFEVTLVANDPSAGEAGPNDGEFMVTRTGLTSGPLVVTYTIGGTASPNPPSGPPAADYVALTGTVSILTGTRESSRWSSWRNRRRR